ncbi:MULTISPECIES: PhzF family phenazine biosynthesis protein [Methylomonas]|uniref:Phenazine biosynthesis protein PhzF n=2 Tax=Methylomonas TaxID=416 RepID=A0A126T3F7_9GAMM|nr:MULTISPECIES: PhzF family phenazine biosynthesis isomerase [Methylomonas]AMK76631.1 phenazine biosynthesis protein PhzF [Methylomonas denitrificans]OAH96287.1 phenazine biosynthesis protein PhzF [Methylomonas methanica]TCV73149.1 trans-2,3-dihydro-3-hydroxyanthranilate isomerase [Methylomonas methanica]
MKYAYYIADVFTQQIFNGAQIAVFPQADGLTDANMALIARELNLSETVFIFHSSGSAKQRRMRIFSPLTELDFGGHPVIATGYVLGLCGDIALSSAITPVIFEQNAGSIQVNISSENGQPSFVQFSSTVKSRVDHFAPSDEELVNILGLNESELDHKKYSPRLISCGFPYLVVPVWNYDSVRKACFNYAAWSQSNAPQTAAQEIILFAPKSPYPDADFNVRLLGPRISQHDDPPVGSAMPAFCSYLCSFEHTQKGTHAFSVDRGQANTRRSVISLEMDNKREESLTIRIGGHAVLVAEGHIQLPENFKV